MGGIASGPANALNADCMPIGPDGTPSHAGRDRMLLGAFTQVSSLLRFLMMASASLSLS